MLKIIYEERGLTLRNMTFSSARDMIEIRKLLKEPEYYQDMINMSIERLHEKYMQAVDASGYYFLWLSLSEKKCFGLDYNDLIKFTLYIFSNNEEIKQKWQKRLEYIMIDEFQDIDDLQYRLMCVLCGYHKTFIWDSSDHLHLARRQCEVSSGFSPEFSRCTDHYDDEKITVPHLRFCGQPTP